MSSDNVVDVSFLADFFFSGSLTIDIQTGDGWTFTLGDGDFAGYTIAIVGAGLGEDGDLPSEGYIKSITVSGPDGDVISASGLHILTEHLFDQLSTVGDAGDGDDGV